MEIGDRIKKIRKTLNVKQSEMAEKLGLQQGSLSDIERGRVKNVTDRVIKDICREYEISESWIKTGEGKMNDPIKDFNEFIATKYRYLEDIDKKIIEEYVKLKPEIRKKMREFFIKISNLR